MSSYLMKVPDIGEGIAEVELVAWHVQVGDVVKEDQALADVMTDKASVEIPSPVHGRVVALGGEVGQMLAVGSDLIRIETDAATATTVAAAPSPQANWPSADDLTLAPAVAPPPSASPEPLVARPVTTPAALVPKRIEGASPGPRWTGRPIASPAVRARAWELGIELRAVTPTGTGGRIVQADLDAHLARRGATSPPPAMLQAEASSRAAVATERASAVPPVPMMPAPPTSDAVHTEKLVGLRRKTAQRMQESKRRIAHFTYVEEVDVGELEALRAALNAKWADRRPHLTLLPFIVRALVLAVREVPRVNARFDDEAGVLHRHDAVHAGIATQTRSGLLVPVLRHAEARDLWSSAEEIARLADAARNGRIVRDEMAGSTITITSLGRLGGIVNTPVINHPEVAIVGINRIVERAVIRGGMVVARPIMNLSSSFDHRVIDGAQAADFVQAVRGYLERPATLFVE
ncbi:MAG TPA: dihydrolipoamide acetyltransferase family protein [Caldimonas sp.]|nr:dihydrolipoamide acetyltransferase family protein [Caldimonas sp.]